MATKTKTPSTSTGKNATSRAKAKGSETPASATGIKIIGTGKYPAVHLKSITIAERPADGEETTKLFYNPRDLSSFTPERMNALKRSIRGEGLIEPPLVRAWTGAGGVVTAVELIAGERRLRSVNQIFDEAAPCFDEDRPQPDQYKPGDVVVHKGNFGTVIKHEGDKVLVEFEGDDAPQQSQCEYADVYPTISGAEMYEFLPCKVLYNCTDERALRLAFTENDQSEPLTIREEIALVERLLRMNKKQEEIAEILSTNVTWVSQTANFRDQLPAEAFEKLMNGQMARHVAVNFLSHAPEDRQKLFEATVAAEKRQTAEKVESLRDEQEKHEDQEELHKAEAAKAERVGDAATATKEKRRAASSASKASKAKERRERAEADSGVIKQGHVKEGQATTGITPKKGKMLDRQQVEDHFCKALTKYVTGDHEDPQTGEKLPNDLISIMRRTALAIMNGCTDPLSVVREYMYDNDLWAKPDEEPDEDDAPVGKKGKGRKKKSDDDEGIDDDDFDVSKVGLDEDDDLENEGDGEFDRAMVDAGLEDDDEGDDFDSDKYDREWN